MLKLYNTLTRKKESFVPLKPNKVGVYVCGMTVYDYCHVGHARVFVGFDMVVRYLRARGFDVQYVRNITDIDDKIIKRAAENGETEAELTERFIKKMHEDECQLGVLSPDHEPKATANIAEIITLIEKIMAEGAAYATEQGEVYFQVSQFPEYGRLANQNVDELRTGARVDVLNDKRDPLDFVLWKQSKAGEPSWDSPWGPGRPGWHIECSAMSGSCLGEQFDIHGGGIDLLFPHHQNEIAQSEAASHKPMVNYWMHMGHVQVNKEKMSKSLGNFFTIRDVLKAYDPEIIRYFMLASHYRSPINYSQANLDSAHQALIRMYTALRGLDILAPNQTRIEFSEHFHEAMEDDFNTPVAFSVLMDLVREINRCKEAEDLHTAGALGGELKQLAGILGFLDQDPEIFLQGGLKTEEIQEIEALIADRRQARADQKWSKADEIRDKLAEMGVLLEDKGDQTLWRIGE